MANTEIRKAARSNFIPIWKIANKIGVSEMTVTRWLRTEMPEERQLLVMNAIEELKQEGA